MAITASQAQGLILTLFGASAGAHLTGLLSATNLSTLAGDAVSTAGLVLGRNLSSDAAFRDLILTENLGLTGTTLTEAQKWMDGEFTKGTSRADIVAAVVTYLEGLTDTTNTFYAAAAAYRTTVADAVTWSQGAGATILKVATLREQQGHTEAVVGSSFTLTTGADTFVGTAGNDTFTGKAADLGATDAIVDSSSTDSDTLTLNGAAFATSIDTSVGASVRNVENVNAVFDSLTASEFKAEGIDTASTITITQARAGSGAAFTVSGLLTGSTVKAGTGVNSLTVTTDTATNNSLTVDGGSADTLVKGTAKGTGSATVTGNSAAEVEAVAVTGTATVTGAVATALKGTGATIVVNGGAADAAITLTGTGTTDKATLNIGGDVTVTNTGTNATTVVETLTVAASAAAKVSVEAGTNYATTYAGDANTTFAGAAAAFSGKTVSGASALTLTALSGTADLSKASVAAINLSADGASTPLLQVNNNANIVIKTAQTAAVVEINADDDVTNTSTTYLKGTVNVELAVANALGANNLVIDASAASTDGFDTVNLKVSKNQAHLDLVTASTTAVVATGSGSVVFDGTTTAKSLDASAMTGAVTIDQANILTVTTGSGKDTITLASTASAVANAGAGNDTINIGVTLAATATVDAGDGTDTMVLSAASDISAATVSGIEYVTLGGYALSANDAQISGKTLVLSGTATNADDDLLIIKDIDSATADLSGLNGTSVDGVYFNATGSSYTIAGTASGLTVAAAANLDATTLGSSVSMNVTGSMFDDVIVTGGAADVVIAGKGDDEVSTGAGADTIDGGAGADFIFGGDGADGITAGEGADNITGGAGADTIVLTETTAAADTVNIASGDSTVGTTAVPAYDMITGFAAVAASNDVLNLVATTVESTATDTNVGAATTATDTITASVNSNGIITLGGVDKANVDTLAEWIEVAKIMATSESAGDGNTVYATVAFEFGGNTYVLQEKSYDAAGATAEVTTVDTFVELVGVTGVTGLSTTAAANVVVLA